MVEIVKRSKVVKWTATSLTRQFLIVITQKLLII